MEPSDRVAAVAELPFVVRLDQDRPGQPQQRLGVGEHPDHIGAALDLLIWNGAVKLGAAGERAPGVPGVLSGGGGRAGVGQDRVGAAWIGGPPL
jgi:hypothetical protein